MVGWRDLRFVIIGNVEPAEEEGKFLFTETSREELDVPLYKRVCFVIPAIVLGIANVIEGVVRKIIGIVLLPLYYFECSKEFYVREFHVVALSELSFGSYLVANSISQLALPYAYYEDGDYQYIDAATKKVLSSDKCLAHSSELELEQKGTVLEEDNVSATTNETQDAETPEIPVTEEVTERKEIMDRIDLYLHNMEVPKEHIVYIKQLIFFLDINGLIKYSETLEEMQITSEQREENAKTKDTIDRIKQYLYNIAMPKENIGRIKQSISIWDVNELIKYSVTLEEMQTIIGWIDDICKKIQTEILSMGIDLKGNVEKIQPVLLVVIEGLIEKIITHLESTESGDVPAGLQEEGDSPLLHNRMKDIPIEIETIRMMPLLSRKYALDTYVELAKLTWKQQKLFTEFTWEESDVKDYFEVRKSLEEDEDRDYLFEVYHAHVADKIYAQYNRIEPTTHDGSQRAITIESEFIHSATREAYEMTISTPDLEDDWQSSDW
ncbi:MAG: hypothetical protein HY860_03505 [Chlamydiales bacterium]|nr:hypothetical protein [Chlamydiales bacterium]